MIATLEEIADLDRFFTSLTLRQLLRLNVAKTLTDDPFIVTNVLRKLKSAEVS